MKNYLSGLFIIFILYISSMPGFIFVPDYYLYNKSLKNAEMDLSSLAISEDDKMSFDYNAFYDDVISLYTDAHFTNVKLKLTDEHKVFILNKCVEGFDLSSMEQEKLAKYLKESVDKIELVPPRDSEEFASFNMFDRNLGPSTYIGNGYVFVELEEVSDGSDYFVFVGPTYKYVGTIGISSWAFNQSLRIMNTIRIVSICFMIIAIIYTVVYWKKRKIKNT